MLLSSCLSKPTKICEGMSGLDSFRVCLVGSDGCDCVWLNVAGFGQTCLDLNTFGWVRLNVLGLS